MDISSRTPEGEPTCCPISHSESIYPTPPDLDSLDLVELIMEVEEDFDVTIPNEEAEQLKTIGDVIDFLYRKLREKQ
jgi:acyl carrier protein